MKWLPFILTCIVGILGLAIVGIMFFGFVWMVLMAVFMSM